MFEFLKNKTPTATEASVWSGRHRSRSRQNESLQVVMDYLKGKQGKRVSYGQISSDLEFTQGYVSTLVKELIKSKAITRKGSRGSYTFTVNRAKVQRRAYNKKKSVPVKEAVSKAVKTVEELRKSSSASPRMSNKYEDRVFEYIKKHQHEFISQAEISRSTNTSQSGVSFAIRGLEERGLISRSVTLPQIGTQYQVMAPGAPVAKVDTTPRHAPVERVMSHDERLIRDFLKFQRERQV